MMTPLAARSAQGAALGLGAPAQPFQSTGAPTQGPFAVDASAQGLADVKANIYRHSDFFRVGGGNTLSRYGDLSDPQFNTDGVYSIQAVEGMGRHQSDAEQIALLCGGKLLPPPTTMTIEPPPIFYQGVTVHDHTTGADRPVSGDPITCLETGITLLSSCSSAAMFPNDTTGVVRNYTVPKGQYIWCSGSMPYLSLIFDTATGSGTVPNGIDILAPGPFSP